MSPTSCVRKVLIGATLVIAALAACQEPSGPDPASGHFVLERRDGQPLPVFVALTATDSVFLEGEELLLRPERLGTRLQTIRLVPRTGGAARMEHVSFELQYRRTAAGRVELTFLCGPNALCSAGPHASGWVTEDGLQLTSGAADATYRRVLPPEPYER